MARFKYTPDPTIGDAPLVLEPNEVFVFGANQLGQHFGGAALAAQKFYGAVMGEIHRTGRSYGLVTLLFPTTTTGAPQRVTKQYLAGEFEDFFKQTLIEPEKTFYLTKVGLGIGGWKFEDVYAAFHWNYKPDIHTNVVLPGAEWEWKEPEVNDNQKEIKKDILRILMSKNILSLGIDPEDLNAVKETVNELCQYVQKKVMGTWSNGCDVSGSMSNELPIEEKEIITNTIKIITRIDE